jgi:hypothetical protein
VDIPSASLAVSVSGKESCSTRFDGWTEGDAFVPSGAPNVVRRPRRRLRRRRAVSDDGSGATSGIAPGSLITGAGAGPGSNGLGGGVRTVVAVPSMLRTRRSLKSTRAFNDSTRIVND